MCLSALWPVGCGDVCFLFCCDMFAFCCDMDECDVFWLLVCEAWMCFGCWFVRFRCDVFWFVRPN